MTNFTWTTTRQVKLKHDEFVFRITLAASQQFEVVFTTNADPNALASQALSDKDNPLSMKSDDMFSGMLDVTCTANQPSIVVRISRDDF
ncbi:hypothetical protein OK016_27495 [Vibrio chagasii]|nr:hypothetical protein [Vibrio chagasii]